MLGLQRAIGASNSAGRHVNVRGRLAAFGQWNGVTQPIIGS